MAELLEVFFVSFLQGAALYTRHVAEVEDLSVDPNQIVEDLWTRRFPDTPHFLHSTSWRWQPGQYIHTYLVYSEAIDATTQLTCIFSLENPPSKEDRSERGRLWHGIRHFSLLVKTDEEAYEALSRLMSHANFKRLQQVPPAPAGRID